MPGMLLLAAVYVAAIASQPELDALNAEIRAHWSRTTAPSSATLTRGFGLRYNFERVLR